MSQPPSCAAAVLVQVTVVEAEACHFCADAREALGDFTARYPIALTIIDAHEALGIELMQTHRAAMSPLILVDGVFFSQGRLPRGKLQRLLDEHMAATTVTR